MQTTTNYNKRAKTDIRETKNNNYYKNIGKITEVQTKALASSTSDHKSGEGLLSSIAKLVLVVGTTAAVVTLLVWCFNGGSFGASSYRNG